jgi:deoxycytidylate deaminase
MTLRLTEQHNIDRGFLLACKGWANESLDPSTKLGAVLVNTEAKIVASGCNNFPPGIEPTSERLNDRETKLKLIVHAERAAVLNAARQGVRTRDTTLYFIAMDKSGHIWGGAPCVACSMELIQAGIRRIVSPPKKLVPTRWAAEIAAAASLLTEAGVQFSEIEL